MKNNIDTKEFIRIQKTEAKKYFAMYLDMLPRFGEIYVQNLSQFVLPMQMFDRPLSQFELDLLSQHRILDSFDWTMLPLLFPQNIPEVKYASELSQIAVVLEVNDEFRALLEHDRSSIQDTALTRPKRLTDSIRLNTIAVSTISHIGVARYAQIFLDSFLCFYLARILTWLTTNEVVISNALRRLRSVKTLRKLPVLLTFRSQSRPRPQTRLDQGFVTLSPDHFGRSRTVAADAPTFEDHNCARPVRTPLDVAKIVARTFDRVFGLRTMGSFDLNLDLLRGMKSIISLYNCGLLRIADYEHYKPALLFVIGFLQVINASGAVGTYQQHQRQTQCAKEIERLQKFIRGWRS